MIFERTRTYSSYTPYSIYFRMFVYIYIYIMHIYSCRICVFSSRGELAVGARDHLIHVFSLADGVCPGSPVSRATKAAREFPEVRCPSMYPEQ